MLPDDSNADPAIASSSLLLGLRERQDAAWQRFLRLYGPLVYSWCRTRWHLTPTDAKDILQEVVVRVMETIGDFQGGNFAAWLWMITRSRVAKRFQRQPERVIGGSDFQQRLAEVPDDHGTQGPADSSDAMEEDVTGFANLTGVLRRALDHVRAGAAATSWQAFWMVTVQGRKPAHVAEELGISANAVYIANSRILRRIRQELGEHEERPKR